MKDYITDVSDGHNKGYIAKFNGAEYHIWYCKDFWQTAQLKNGYFCDHRPYHHYFVGEIQVHPNGGTLNEYDDQKSLEDAFEYIDRIKSFMSSKRDDAISRFKAVAKELEKTGTPVSVCDNCQETYPEDWVVFHACPFCGKKHTNEEAQDEL